MRPKDHGTDGWQTRCFTHSAEIPTEQNHIKVVAFIYTSNFVVELTPFNYISITHELYFKPKLFSKLVTYPSNLS